MHKDIIISILGAFIIAELPCFEIHNSAEKIAMIVGIASAVFIFCLFCEDLHEKWKKKQKRVQEMYEKIGQLRQLSLRKEEI